MSKYRGQSNKNGVNVPNGTLTIYCRTSGKNVKNELSLEVQEERGIKLSEQLGLKPIVIKEQGSGLKKYENERPLFQELMDDVMEGKIKNVWVDEDTRLTRNKEDQGWIYSDFVKQDIVFYTGLDKRPKDLNSFEVDLISSITVRINERNIKGQIRKSNRSKRKLFQQGCYMKGNSPFGYMVEDKKLVLHPINSKWVVKMFDWYNSGKSNWWIREQLFQNNVSPPQSKRGFWNGTSLTKLLQNKNYIGIDTYGDLVNECPKIIDEKIFHSVQQLITRNKSTGVLKYKYLLKGFVKCVDNLPMGVQGKNKTQKYDLYQCSQKTRKYKKRPHTPCSVCPKFRNLKQDVLDEVVWNTLIEVLGKSHIIKEKVKTEVLGKKVGHTKRILTNKINKIQNELKDTEKRKLELDGRYYTRDISDKDYRIISDRVKTSKEMIENELINCLMKKETLNGKTEWIDWLGIHLQRISDYKGMTGYEERIKVIQKYIHQVQVHNYEPETKTHSLRIDFKLPLFNDDFEWERNKNGSFKTLKNGVRKSKVLNGKNRNDHP